MQQMIFIADLIACSTIPTTWKPSTKYDRQQQLV